jgi:predicted HD phosphohydrolase
MADVRIRQQIAFEAARLMYDRVETEYYTAKRKAARLLRVEHRFKPGDLPSNAEIREQIQVFARLYEGEKRKDNLRSMRVEALRLMRHLRRFRPRLIGSVWTGHVRKGSDIDIHVFSNSLDAVTSVLDENGLEYAVEHKRIVKFQEERVFTHIHVYDRFNLELTVYSEDKVNYPFRSSITGKPIEKASIAELEAALRAERPDEDLDRAIESVEDHIDRFELYRLLLQPLERTKQSAKYHPEGDVLYHSLQVFELARQARPYDEEFLLAALLHDVGKAIDPANHVEAGLDALEGAITDRTRFLIEHHMEALAYRQGTLSARARKRLQSSEDFEDLMLLRELDAKGRVAGADTCSIAQAIDYLRSLDSEAYLEGNDSE